MNAPSPASAPNDQDRDSTKQFQLFQEQHLGASTEALPDGQIRRFADPEKSSSNTNCWAVLQPYGTRGTCGNWGTGEKHHWRSDASVQLSPDEIRALQQRVDTAYRDQTEKRRDSQKSAADEARRTLTQSSPPRDNHPYLNRKAILPEHCRQWGENLIVPLVNVDGKVRNLQKIDPKGRKRFLPGGEVAGNFALVGADSLPQSGRLIVCEGFATAVTLHRGKGIPVAAAMSAGNLIEVSQRLRKALPRDVAITIAADDDRQTDGNPGLAHAYLAADLTGAGIITPQFLCTTCDCTDFNDLAACPKRVPGDPVPAEAVPNENGVVPLEGTLPRVMSFSEAMLPASFVGFVASTAERLQVPQDYLAVTAMACAAGVVGRKAMIHPKQYDPWTVVPTLWAGLIGGPSTLKSACLSASKQPLEEIEKQFAEDYVEEKRNHELLNELMEASRKDIKKEAAKHFTTDKQKALDILSGASVNEEPPVHSRLVINDATVEKLGEIMRDNSNGMILVRDELSGWLSKLADEERQGDRAFYLECFEGQNAFTWDRIGRGTIRIEHCVLSIAGGIQPSKIAPIIEQAISGATDDGLIQRFQLAVWPDIPKTWRWVDKPRDQETYNRYESALNKLHQLSSPTEEQDPLTLRFTPQAQELYRTWMEDLQTRLRADDMHRVLQSHLAKMPKTIASIALLSELLDGGRDAVGEAAIKRALLWAEYLESHAQRIYSVTGTKGVSDAKVILKRRHTLPEIFTARDVARKGWTGLSKTADVAEALHLLVEHRYLTEIATPALQSGGRRTVRYRWHPQLDSDSG